MKFLRKIQDNLEGIVWIVLLTIVGGIFFFLLLALLGYDWLVEQVRGKKQYSDFDFFDFDE